MNADVQTPEPATYRVSAILSGLRAMWRAAGAALLFIAINAAVQAGLMYVDAQSGFTVGFLLSFTVSAAAALVLYAVLTACALESVDGTASFGSVVARIRDHFLTFTRWAAVQWLLLLLAALINMGLILLVAAMTPFLPLAALDGHRNAFGENFRAMGRQLGRWLLTTTVLIVAGLLLYLLSAVNTFFIKGTPAAAIFWLVIGVVAWWLLTAWALIYRDSGGSQLAPAEA